MCACLQVSAILPDFFEIAVGHAKHGPSKMRVDNGLLIWTRTIPVDIMMPSSVSQGAGSTACILCVLTSGRRWALHYTSPGNGYT